MEQKYALFTLLSLLFVLNIHCCSSSTKGPDSEEKNYYIIDADAGSDDAMAIMYSLFATQRNPKFELLGITTVAGNTGIENVIKNVALTLKIMGQPNIPIYKGSRSSILGGSVTDGYFGSDGLSNATAYYEEPTPNLQQKSAVDALVELVNKYPGKVTILCLGPLTNIALAHLIDPNFLKLAKELYVIGGSYAAHGNVNAAAEFNFHFDPEAAYIVTKHATCPVFIVPWETMKWQSIHWDNYSELIKIDSDKARFFQRITSVLHGMKGGNSTVTNFVVGDLLAASSFFVSQTVTAVKRWPATVELHGLHTRGQLVIDKRFLFSHGLFFITRMNRTLMFDLFKQMLL